MMNDDIRKRIRDRMERAKQNPITLAMLETHGFDDNRVVLELQDRKPDLIRPPNEHIEIPNGYLAAYSVEDQPPGLCGHLSISVETPGMLPNPIAVKAIAMEFDIDEPLRMWIEEFAPGHRAVNVLGLLKKSRSLKQ